MGWIVLGVLGLAAAAALVYAVGIYNGLVALKHAVDRAWANVDVLLKQRHDELPKLVDTVRGYLRHERELLERLTAARARLAGAASVEEKGRADGELRQALDRLFAVAEGYPDLKADQSFQMLQGRISELEDQIADRREFFNHSVNAHNVRIEQLPDVFLARWLGLQPRTLFRAQPREREDVRIELG
jgi:LemA protein